VIDRSFDVTRDVHLFHLPQCDEREIVQIFRFHSNVDFDWGGSFQKPVTRTSLRRLHANLVVTSWSKASDTKCTASVGLRLFLGNAASLHVTGSEGLHRYAILTITIEGVDTSINTESHAISNDFQVDCRAFYYVNHLTRRFKLVLLLHGTKIVLSGTEMRESQRAIVVRHIVAHASTIARVSVNE